MIHNVVGEEVRASGAGQGGKRKDERRAAARQTTRLQRPGIVTPTQRAAGAAGARAGATAAGAAGAVQQEQEQ
eukprot:6896367-Alexandrium_andersonii.AAC.2